MKTKREAGGAGGGKFRQYQSEMNDNKKQIEDWELSKPKKQEGDTDEFYQDQLRIWNEKKPGKIKYNAMEMWGGALVSMGAEYAGSRLIAMPMINRAKAFTGFGVKAGFTSAFAKKILASTYTYAGDLISEGTEEVFAEGAGNLYDRLILGKDVNVFDGWKDNFFSGVVMANGFKAPALFSPYINAAQTPGDKSNILGKQNQIKDMLNFCDLKFEQNCMDFHKNKRAIKTVSSSQARNKIYSSSINSYKNYEKFLINLFSSLDNI